MLFENKKHEVYTVNKYKIALNRDDDKRLVQADGITTLARDMQRLRLNNHYRCFHNHWIVMKNLQYIFCRNLERKCAAASEYIFCVSVCIFCISMFFKERAAAAESYQWTTASERKFAAVSAYFAQKLCSFLYDCS